MNGFVRQAAILKVLEGYKSHYNVQCMGLIVVTFTRSKFFSNADVTAPDSKSSAPGFRSHHCDVEDGVGHDFVSA